MPSILPPPESKLMSLNEVKCPNCGKKVISTAPACPNCGEKISVESPGDMKRVRHEPDNLPPAASDTYGPPEDEK